MNKSAVWGNYYSNGYLPWDTKAPSSHLLYYLNQCPSLIARKGNEDIFIPDCQPVKGEYKARQGQLLHICPDCQKMKPSQGLQTNCLELACGTGSSCIYMAKVFTMGRSIGLDLVAEAVSSSRSLAAEEGVLHNCAFMQADVFSLQTPGTRWDVEAAWALSQQQHKDLMELSAEASSALKKEEDIKDDSRSTRRSPPTFRAHPREATEMAVHTSSTSDVPLHSDAPPKPTYLFDFIYDCQAFHALRHVDEAAYLQLLHSSLKPGGLLMLLTGNANEPDCGPSVLTKQDLLLAFPDSLWEWVFLVQSRFDATPAYVAPGRDRLPLAWWGLVRKR
ncbi:hypothetical protein CEUSTIGMA_g2749.t1 [Chlamydomonas eustigma]|uniref:Methyltransferase domain-containing protein n=1 Tax=Chlamydomonas eustigma TaxID=1157962 RepID=A0A250WWU3_9CHLO|nr:hypothetical protein CEUSTIGMA_g2749.t1 [Chlamydomonas eustigma]|eukprot:GAX75304.1 hypothetical protein CEUSTIGMA_g2749.t1 [Chlamydomonas eustigma]